MSRKSKYPPFAIARQHAHELSLQSTSAYIKWHKENKPLFVPRYPDSVYKKDWVSWNDWLGTNNVFKTKDVKVYRPYWEAVKWSQANAATHDIDTGAQWVKWCKDNTLPVDVPHNPEAVYDEFKGNGWSVWLGQDVRSKLKALGQPTHLIAFCSSSNMQTPGNYYQIVHARNGHADLKEKLEHSKDLKVYRAYNWDEEIAEQVNKMIESHSKEAGEGMLFIPNLNALLFELDCMLEWVPIKKVGVDVTIAQKAYEVPFVDQMYIKRV